MVSPLPLHIINPVTPPDVATPNHTQHTDWVQMDMTTTATISSIMTDATVYHLNLRFLPRFLQKRSQEGTDIIMTSLL